MRRFQLPRFALPALVLWIAYSTGVAHGQMSVGWENQLGEFEVVGQNGVSSASDGVYIGGGTQVLVGGAWDSVPFTSKYDLDGRKLWTQTILASGLVYAVSAAVDGVYIAGVMGQAFVAKYDLSGNRLWLQQFALGPSTVANAVSATSEGLYVAGRSWASPSGGPQTGPAFVRKYDLNGNELWTVQFWPASWPVSWSVSVSAAAGGVYVAGTIASPEDIHGIGADAFVLKYDLNGNLLWTRQFGTSGWDGARGVSATTDGVYVAGDGALTGITSGGPDTFIRKYDFNGNVLWTRQFGPNWAVGLSATANGVFSLALSVDVNTYHISQYDPNGNRIGVLKLPAHGSSGAIDAATGRIYVAGWSPYPQSVLAMLIPVSSAPRPGSEVSPLPAVELSVNFNVQWSGWDSGGPGIQNYTISVSNNGGAFTPWLTQTTGTQATFTGVSGHTYGFYSIARDAAGNVESPKSVADTITRVDTVKPVSHVSSLPATTTSPNFQVQWSGTDAGGPGIGKYNVYVSDNGGSFALWQTNTSATQAWFPGYLGHTYAFFSRATDVVGKQEDLKSAAEATTRTPARMPENVNGDGQINCLDIAMVKAAMGSTPGQPNWNPAADVNGDGVVNVRDLALVSQKLMPGTNCY